MTTPKTQLELNFKSLQPNKLKGGDSLMKKMSKKIKKASATLEKQKEKELKILKKTKDKVVEKASAAKSKTVDLGKKLKQSASNKYTKLTKKSNSDDSSGFKKNKKMFNNKILNPLKKIKDKAKQKTNVVKENYRDARDLSSYKEIQKWKTKKKEQLTRLKTRIAETDFVQSIIIDVKWLRSQLPEFDGITQSFDLEKVKGDTVNTENEIVE